MTPSARLTWVHMYEQTGDAGLSVGLNQVVLGLKVEPELRIAAEPVTEAERGGAGDRALTCVDGSLGDFGRL